MRLIYRRCLICLAWYSPIARTHCAHCGSFPIARKAGVDGQPKLHGVRGSDQKFRSIKSVCGMPLALRAAYYSK